MFAKLIIISWVSEKQFCMSGSLLLRFRYDWIVCHFYTKSRLHKRKIVNIFLYSPLQINFVEHAAAVRPKDKHACML